ncbi:Clavaminate synthase-like protein [Mycena rosella]|uniref:Clavaminate synthase-like protein n=1 Tax=Mycena rosella TaxID=1033263 RepID=A0AAD7D7X9_MYCRO|nr:Clavaminate synthase-like protein [Mycena rosella]
MASPEDVVKNAKISVVDFAAFLDGSNKQAVADNILASFKTTGFVYLLNYGVRPEQVATIFDVSKEFFAQPMDVKSSAPRLASGTHHRGYSPVGHTKNHGPSYVSEVNERFECGREDDKRMPNVWLPDGKMPEFRESCLDFFWACNEVASNILRALALGLGLREDYFHQYHAAADNQLTLFHYVSAPLEVLEQNDRIGEHSDTTSVTLLFQDDVGGLEFEDPAAPGSFLPAPPISGALIVNIGDFMMRWSNDTIRSTVHRVRPPPGCQTQDGKVPSRYSIPFFCNANFDTVVDCIPGTWDAEHPKKYEPITAGKYILDQIAETYDGES